MVRVQSWQLRWRDVNGSGRYLYFGATDALLPPGRFFHVFMWRDWGVLYTWSSF